MDELIDLYNYTILPAMFRCRCYIDVMSVMIKTCCCTRDVALPFTALSLITLYHA